MNTDSKPALASQTIWGGITTLASCAMAAFLAYQSHDPATLGVSIAGFFGGILSIVGRYKATSTIGKAVVAIVDDGLTLAQSAAPQLAAVMTSGNGTSGSTVVTIQPATPQPAAQFQPIPQPN